MRSPSNEAQSLTYPALDPHPMTKSAFALLPSVRPLAVLALVLVFGAFLIPLPVAAVLVLAAGLACAATAGLVWLMGIWRRRSEQRLRNIVVGLIDGEATPAIMTESSGFRDISQSGRQRPVRRQ